jgi:hypothetical protein
VHGCNRLDDAIDETVVLPSNDQYASAKAVSTHVSPHRSKGRGHREVDR